MTPEIRFDGFKGNWNIDTLDILTDVYDGTHQTPLYENSGIMFLSVENIKTLTSKKYISEKAFYSDFNVFPQKGDVLMTRIGDIGTANIVESDKPVAFYVSLALLKKKSLDPYFLKAVISSEAVWRELWHRTLHIAFPKKINVNEIKRVPVNYPTDENEQAAIGNFFRTIDDMITLKKQQYGQTKNIKKAMLEKMFPKKGADAPEIRFDGFTGAWKERIIGDVAVFSKGNGYSKADLTDCGIPIILYGRLYTKYETVIDDVDTYTILKANSVISLGGEIIVPSSGETAEDIARASVVVKSGVVLGGDLNIVSADKTIDPIFLALTISNGAPQRELSKKAQGKSVVHIRNSDLKEIRLPVPDVKEQTAIGNFFRSLDALIEAQLEELKKLKNIKKACLSKMFV
ncbi:MAG: restriction endonuclease subunit S [Deferribacteraceae bacterium]|jgi:type I restriction enzyme S subunit|nr:restriction endonuclease subunit S [Deferribacteraceae bacterium]